MKIISKILLLVLFYLGFSFGFSPNFSRSAYAADSNKGLKDALGKTDTKAPLFINSDSLSLNAEKRTFTYSGNVTLKQGDVEITADKVIGKYNEANVIHTVVCEDNIVFTKGEGMRANANRAVYKVAESTIVLSEAPELARAGNILSADKITIYVDEDRSEAEGNVRVKVIQGEGDEIKTPLNKGALKNS